MVAGADLELWTAVWAIRAPARGKEAGAVVASWIGPPHEWLAEGLPVKQEKWIP
jgi:hypothetical protein